MACTQGAANSVDQADTATARALIAAHELHASLAGADRAASHAFLSGDVLLGGPGQEYRDAVAGASRALEQLAEVLGAGVESQRLQAVHAGLVTYVGLVEQADAAFRAEAAGPPSQRVGLGRAYLWYASKMLHEPADGLLARSDVLVTGRERAIGARSWWLGSGPLRVFPVLVVAWVGGLLGGQVWSARRFRRVLNPSLVAATLLALLASGWAAAGIAHLQRGYDSAEADALRPLLVGWQVRAEAADIDGLAALLVVEAVQCPAGSACTGMLASLEQTLSVAEQDAARFRLQRADIMPPTTRQKMTSVLDACATVRTAVRAGAVEQAAKESGRAEADFRDLDLAFADSIHRLGVSWSSEAAAARHVPGLKAGIIAPAALAVLLTAWGFTGRLREYRVGVRG